MCILLLFILVSSIRLDNKVQSEEMKQSICHCMYIQLTDFQKVIGRENV